MPGNLPSESQGLLASLTALAATLVAIAHTRLDLLSTDLDEEREHFSSMLMLTLTALFFLGLGVVLTTILLVAFFWESHRILVLGLIAGCFFSVSLAAWGRAMYKTRTKPRLFAVSMAELLKDRQQLVSRP